MRAVFDWRSEGDFSFGGLRLAVCVWGFAFGGLRLAVCVWRFAFGGLRLAVYCGRFAGVLQAFCWRFAGGLWLLSIVNRYDNVSNVSWVRLSAHGVAALRTHAGEHSISVSLRLAV